MPSRMLSCLLASVETTIRYLTLTELTESNCTACMKRYTEGGMTGKHTTCEHCVLHAKKKKKNHGFLFKSKVAK